MAFSPEHVGPFLGLGLSPCPLHDRCMFNRLTTKEVPHLRNHNATSVIARNISVPFHRDEKGEAQTFRELPELWMATEGLPKLKPWTVNQMLSARLSCQGYQRKWMEFQSNPTAPRVRLGIYPPQPLQTQHQRGQTKNAN